MMKNLFIALLLMASLDLFAQDDLAFKSIEQPTLSIENDILRKVAISDMPIDSTLLYQSIDGIMQLALDSAAFPGGVVLLAQNGKVFFEKAYGYHTYEKINLVKTSDIYDLASVTKTTAATLALMKLYDQGKFDLDQTMGYYWPSIAKGKKRDLVMRDVLAHQAGLRAWIPYWSESQKKNGKYRRKTVSSDSSAKYPYKISEAGLYMHKDFIEKKIKRMIKKSKVSDEKKYLYSGLTFYLIPELVERLSGKPFDDFLYDEFYKPIGSQTLRFNAGQSFDMKTIVPTEVDSFFRMQTLHGVVHDEGAAMMLGVSGNAGLFANAMDLGKVYQMLLNGGIYGGKRYLTQETVNEFTRVQFPENDNRRGLGFDKPLLEYDKEGSSSAYLASQATFGHSGYTGTLVWADPENDILFVFLSNRVHPTRDNRKIYTLGIRPAIHNAVYELFNAYQGKYAVGFRGEN